MSEKQQPKSLLDTPLVKVEFEIAKWVVDFVEEYLKFLGSTWTVETMVRDAFFEEICKIRGKLQDFHHQGDNDFFNKYHNIALLDDREEQKRLVELEKRNDC